MITVARITNDKKLELYDEVMEYPTELEGERNYFVVANMEPRQPVIDAYRHYTFKVGPKQLHTLSVYGVPQGRSFTVDEIEVWFNEAKDGYQFSSNSDGIVTVALWEYEDVPFIGGTAKIKLEKGNKATDWTPAPEDLGYDFPPEITSFKPGISSGGILLTPEIIEDDIFRLEKDSFTVSELEEGGDLNG